MTAAKTEIAGLILERHTLEGTSKAAMQELLEQNIFQKIKEYEDVYGEVSFSELRKFFNGLQTGEQTTKKWVKARQKEQEKIVLSKIIFKSEMGVFSNLDDSKLAWGTGRGVNVFIAGSGVQWSADDQIVLLRSETKEARLINLKTGKPFNLDASTGFLNKSGNFYATNPLPNLTRIHNLKTGETFELTGNPIKDSFNDQFIRMENLTLGNLGRADRIRSVVALSNQRAIALPDRHVISEDLSKVVLIKNNRLEAIDVSTGQVIHTESTDGKTYNISGGVGRTYIAQKDGKKYLVRTSDLKEFLIPDGDFLYMSSDEKKVVCRIRGAYLLYNLETHAKKEVPFPYNLFLNNQKTVALASGGAGNPTILYDLDTFQGTEIPGNYNHFSADGAWVYSVKKSGKIYQFNAYRLRDGKVIAFDGQSEFSFPKHEDHHYRLSQDPITNIIYLNESWQLGADAQQVPLDFKNANISPSGKYLVTYSGGDNGAVEIRRFLVGGTKK